MLIQVTTYYNENGDDGEIKLSSDDFQSLDNEDQHVLNAIQREVNKIEEEVTVDQGGHIDNRKRQVHEIDIVGVTFDTKKEARQLAEKTLDTFEALMVKLVQAKVTHLNPASILKTGCKIHYDEHWIGQVGPKRHPEKDPTRVKSVYIHLTPAEWCSLGQREGDNYIGGCCGNASAIQDYFCAALRDGGYLDADFFISLAAQCGTHEGFELFDEILTQEQFDERVANWNKTHVFDKFALLYLAIKNELIPTSKVHGEKLDVNDEKDLVRTVRDGLFSLSWGDLFSRDDQEKENGQHIAARSLQMAKIIPAVNALNEAFKKSVFTGFNGYAIVSNKNNEVLKNGYGICLYAKPEAAEEVIRLWEKNDKNIRNLVSVKSASVTLEDGLKIT